MYRPTYNGLVLLLMLFAGVLIPWDAVSRYGTSRAYSVGQLLPVVVTYLIILSIAVYISLCGHGVARGPKRTVRLRLAPGEWAWLGPIDLRSREHVRLIFKAIDVTPKGHGGRGFYLKFAPVKAGNEPDTPPPDSETIPWPLIGLTGPTAQMVYIKEGAGQYMLGLGFETKGASGVELNLHISYQAAVVFYIPKSDRR